MRRAAIVATFALLIALPVGSAQAARPFQTGIVEANHVASDQALQTRWFDESVNAHADLFRITVSWRAVAPDPPENPQNPADPAYRFAEIDDAITEGASRGLEPLLIVYNAPGWAEDGNRPGLAQPGSWKPDPAAYRDFAVALGTRYSGAFASPAGLMPQVRYFEAWAEPNLPIYLAPQRDDGRLFAAERYRELVNGFRAGIRQVNPAASIVGPGTSPFGTGPSGKVGSTRPLVFLRNLLCLNAKNKPTSRDCTPATIDIIGHNPINPLGGPGDRPANPDDVVVGNFASVRKVVRAAENADTIEPAGRRPLWATEVWWESDPPADDDSIGVSPATQARWLAQSFYSLWRQGAEAAIWYELVDPPARPNGGQLETGLFFSDGRPKPAFDAFRFPFVVQHAGKRHVRVWTLPPAGGSLVIEQRSASGWKPVGQFDAQGRPAPFVQRLQARGKKPLRARLGDEVSLEASLGKRPGD